MSRVVQPLQQMGAKIWGRQGGSLAPLAIQDRRCNRFTTTPDCICPSQVLYPLAGLMAQGQTTVTEPALS
jgi:3-phosphoshikimate 1-carboxyvinyltransferase